MHSLWCLYALGENGEAFYRFAKVIVDQIYTWCTFDTRTSVLTPNVRRNVICDRVVSSAIVLASAYTDVRLCA